MSELTDDRVHKALAYMATTDRECTEMMVEVARIEKRRKLLWSQAFLDARGQGSVEDRKALAEVSAQVQAADEDYLKALGAFEYMKAKRQTEEWIIRAWQSEAKNRRQGNV